MKKWFKRGVIFCLCVVQMLGLIWTHEPLYGFCQVYLNKDILIYPINEHGVYIAKDVDSVKKYYVNEGWKYKGEIVKEIIFEDSDKSSTMVVNLSQVKKHYVIFSRDIKNRVTWDNEIKNGKELLGDGSF